MQPTAIVTGVTRGLGRAVGEFLAARGWRVHGVARDAAALDSLDFLVSRAVVDLSAPDAADRVLSGLSLAGRTLLVNNAAALGPVGDESLAGPDEVQRVWQLNVLTPARLSRLIAREVRERPGATGLVVNVSSGAALQPLSGWATYCATKASLWMHTRTLALEWANSPMRICAFSPGLVDTDMQQGIRALDEETFADVGYFRNAHREGLLRSPAEVATALVELIDYEPFPHGEHVSLPPVESDE